MNRYYGGLLLGLALGVGFLSRGSLGKADAPDRKGKRTPTTELADAPGSAPTAEFQAAPPPPMPHRVPRDRAPQGVASADAPLPEAPPSDSPPERHSAGLNRESLGILDTALHAEPRDTWAERDLRASVETSFASANTQGLSIDAIECNSSLCKLDLKTQAASRPDGALVIEQLASMRPHGGIVLSTNEELLGNGKAVAYLAKVDSRLPSLP